MKRNTVIAAGSLEITVKDLRITVEDLRTGRRARINEAECEQVTGRKRTSLRRDRWLGKGIQFLKDENGRVWYAAEDVLAYLDKTSKHKSISEYDTSKNISHLELAREAKQKLAREAKRKLACEAKRIKKTSGD